MFYTSDMKSTWRYLRIFLLLSQGIYLGCAPVISKPALKDAEEPPVEAVQKNPEAFKGKKVLWGGIILDVENLEETTVIEVFRTALGYTKKPTGEVAGGRFLVSAAGYLDPIVYKPKSGITVAGTVKGVEVKKIGKMDYLYPVLTPLEMHVEEIEAPLYPAAPLPWPYYPYWPYYWPYWPYPYPP
jgi:outer membrane lipoprotein